MGSFPPAAVITVPDRDLVRDHNGDVVPVLNAGGEPMRWVLREVGRRVYADAADDLLGHLIPRYPTGEETSTAGARLEARIRHAAAIKTQLDARALADAPRDLTEQELAIVCADAWHPVEQRTWTGPIALTLLDVAYQPFTQRLAPAGPIRWLEVSDATSYLRSLARSGVISLGEAL